MCPSVQIPRSQLLRQWNDLIFGTPSSITRLELSEVGFDPRGSAHRIHRSMVQSLQRYLHIQASVIGLPPLPVTQTRFLPARTQPALSLEELQRLPVRVSLGSLFVQSRRSTASSKRPTTSASRMCSSTYSIPRAPRSMT